VIDAEITALKCFGDENGSIDLFIDGGVLPHTYVWEDGSSQQWRENLPAGSFTVTVTDANGCSQERLFLLTQPDAITLTTTIKNPTCHGSNNGIVHAIANGGVGSYSWTWSDGAAGSYRADLNAGNYLITVTDDNGCITTTMVSLVDPDSITVTGVTTPSQCDGPGTGSITTTASGGTGILSFSWSDGASSPNRAMLNTGSYLLTVTDANGCQVSQTFLIKENGCEIWYADRQICVLIGRCGELPTFDFTVEIFDLSGKRVRGFTGTAINGYFQGCFDLSGLPSGVYAVKVNGGDAIKYGGRIVIN